MAINVGGPTGSGRDLAPITPIQNPLARHPELQALDTAPRPRDSYESGWAEISNSLGETSWEASRREMGEAGFGTRLGGPSMVDMRTLADPHAFTVRPREPVLTSEQMGMVTPLTTAAGRNSAGNIDLNLLEPLEFPMDLTTGFIGQERPPPGQGFDPSRFLADREIDLLGNLPSRLLDYAAAIPALALGMSKNGVEQRDAMGDLYPFQRDARYWTWVGSVDEVGIAQMARTAAVQYTGGQPNEKFVHALVQQFRRDREMMLGLSSGDEAIDYRAKQLAWTIQLAKQTGNIDALLGPTSIAGMGEAPSQLLPAIPFIGTQLAGFFDPVTDEMDELWESLTIEERQGYMSSAGLQQFVGSTLVTLPIMASGAGFVAAVASKAAAAGGSLGARALQTYNTGLDVMTQVMRAGLTVAVTNWAAEIAIPGYAATLGKQIDEARPISDSPFAAAVNAFGYFASPKELFGPFYRTPLAAVRTLRGESEIGIYRAMGGRESVRAVAKAYAPTREGAVDLSEHAFETSLKKLTLSEAMGVVKDRFVSHITTRLQNVDDPHWRNVPLEDRVALATQELMSLQGGRLEAATFEMLKWHTMGRAPLRPGALFNERVLHDDMARLARTIDDDITRRHAMSYGSTRIMREIGAGQGVQYGVPAIQGALQAQAQRLGYTIDMPALERSINGLVSRGLQGQNRGDVLPAWESFYRLMKQREFDHIVGQVTAAAAGTTEAARLNVVRADHLFADLHRDLLESVNAALAARGGASGPARAAARAKAADLIRRTPELDEWWASLPESAFRDRDGSLLPKAPENLPLNMLRDHLVAIEHGLLHRRIRPGPSEPTATRPLNALHADMDAAGQWTLAYKPGFNDELLGGAGVAEGTYASYHYLPDRKTFFQSPYTEYPLSSPDAVNLGGQGFLASRVDSLTRAFRTWRIGEFQRSLTTRIVTRYDGVTAAQVDAFYEGVQTIARTRQLGFGKVATHVSAQAVASAERAGRAGGVTGRAADLIGARGDIQALAHRIFGRRQYRNLDSGELEDVDWALVVQEGFRQSFRFNMTAGVTGRLKTLPHGWGDMVILTSDFVVPMLRFTLSPIFRVSEYVESSMLNAMRATGGDPIARMLYARAGIMREGGTAGHFINDDPMAGALATSPAAGGRFTPRANEGALLATARRRLHPSETAAVERAEARVMPGAVDLPGGPGAPEPRPLPRDPVRDELDMEITQSLNEVAAVVSERDLALADDALVDAAIARHFEAVSARNEYLAQRVAETDAIATVNAYHERWNVKIQPSGAAKELLDADLTFARSLQRLRDDPGNQDLNDALVLAYERRQRALRDLEATGPPPATDWRDIEGSAERTEAMLEAAIERQPSAIRRKMQEVFSPNEFKEAAMTDLQISLFRDMFPQVLKASGNRAADVLRDLGIPEREWTKFLIVDRTRMGGFQDDPSPGAFQRLLGWADEARTKRPAAAAQLDELYESEDWQTMATLWALGAKAAQDEAFGVHFFSPYRSQLGRSINHPLLGAYPAAWAYKAANEWFRFLYDNRMLGNGLRLGMSPAVAINAIMEAQNRAFAAATGGDSLAEWLEDGPLGSSVFIFNLLLPGDWSSIPFPLSRSLRLAIRGEYDPAQHIYQNLVGSGPYGVGGGGMGAIRDVRLFSESYEELKKLWEAPEPTDAEERFNRIVSTWTDDGVPLKPVNARYISAYP